MSGGVQGSQRGFTIIELLIATLVFSVILIVITTGVMRFSRQYYKGVISSATQDTARILVDDIARAIQFNGGNVAILTTNNLAVPPNPSAPPVGYCIGGSKRYSFALNRQIKSVNPDTTMHQSRHALVSDNISGCSTNTRALDTAALTTLTTPNARELLGEHMRLNKFSIKGSEGVYTINVKVVYGDDDLLCSPSVPDDCNADSGLSTSLNNPDVTCRSMPGAQFCAVSELTTTVKKRVN